MGEAWLRESQKERCKAWLSCQLPADLSLVWSVGLLYKCQAKRATLSPIHLVLGAVGDSKQGQELPSDFHTHSPTAKHIKIPIAK